MKEILVTGGAGYIGSHVVKLLAEHAYHPVIYDNLSTGFRELTGEHEFIEGDIGDYDRLAALFAKRSFMGVMNFASFIAVGESVTEPLKYYENNVARTLALLRAMNDHGVKRFILSSTAAVYGYPDRVPITEESRLDPINPYGRTKLFVEKILADLDMATAMKSICLRYFNAAGADPSGAIGEMHMPETHLIPLVMRSILEEGYTLKIYGTDYETPDGTCIRDYIHVNDLALAHLLALERLVETGASDVFNLGNGTGFSVREVVDSVRRVTGSVPRVSEGPRRPGDPPALVASSDRAARVLGWKTAFPHVDDVVESAWRWESQRRRKGY